MSNKPADQRWTEEADEEITRLWKEGWSAGQIVPEASRILGRPVTRNGVIGRLGRLKLLGTRAEPKKTMPRNRARKKPSAPVGLQVKPQFNFGFGDPAKRSDTVLPPQDIDHTPICVPETTRVTLDDLRPGVCRFPLGDPRDDDFGYCGANCDLVKPYCTAHHALCYVPVQRGKKVAWRAFR